MKTTPTPPIAGAAPVKKLRNALAIARARKLLMTLQQEAESTISHDQTKRVTYLNELFSRIHREIFHDWKEQATVSHRPGQMPNADKRKEFRMNIERLVMSGGSQGTELFDNNGFVIKTPNIAERLAHFYQNMGRVRPFDFGNRLALDVFMTALSNLPAFKGVYEKSIDFRRLDAQDAQALHNLNSSIEELTLAFQHALDPARTRCLPNVPNGYGLWPENKRFVASIPFLSHTTEDGVDCLVTVNGGLVPRSTIKAELYVTGMQVADFPLSLSENVIGYLPGTELLRVPGKTEIDGIRVGENGVAPLFCLDINIMTGLRHASHTELREIIKQCEGESASVFDLADNPELKAKLIAAANDDERLERTIEIAYARLNRILKKLDEAKRAIFAGKQPDDNPKLFMSMGGAGAGKTAVEEIARAQCGENFVIASLDEFRKQSDLYTVLTAANHHSDDYVFIEPFANRLRDQVADHARTAHINILYDGTGIPYTPRYHNVVNSFKRAGFRTQITAIDAFIVKPKGREHELSRAAVIESVKQRFERTGRALPWVVTVDKHIRSPWAFLEALEHEALDKISLFANDGERDRHYLVAESFAFAEREVRDLQDHQKSGRLAEFLENASRVRGGSILKTLAGGDAQKIDALLARNPALNESNVAYLVYHSKHGSRVLAIYNTRRMVDFLVKRQLNPNASGEEGLLHKHASLAFHIDPGAKEPWIIRLQHASSETMPESF
jgi:fido (protein-threonine AMPylation protein)